MKLVHLLSVFVSLTLLTGCFQVQLGSPVGATAVTIQRLGDTDIDAQGVSETEDDKIAELGLDRWQELGQSVQLLFLGDVDVDVSSLSSSSFVWYVITASGGNEYLVEQGGLSDRGVIGEWRALVSGQHLRDANGITRVTLATELAYQYVKDELEFNDPNEAAIESILNEFAAGALTKDLSGDGVTDYTDILAYSPLFHRNFLNVGATKRDQLLDQVVQGASDAEIEQTAEDVFTESLPDYDGNPGGWNYVAIDLNPQRYCEEFGAQCLDGDTARGTYGTMEFRERYIKKGNNYEYQTQLLSATVDYWVGPPGTGSVVTSYEEGRVSRGDQVCSGVFEGYFEGLDFSVTGSHPGKEDPAFPEPKRKQIGTKLITTGSLNSWWYPYAEQNVFPTWVVSTTQVGSCFSV